MDGLAEYGEEAWFRLGDRDFATHIARTARIREGRALTAVVLSLQARTRHPDRDPADGRRAGPDPGPHR